MLICKLMLVALVYIALEMVERNAKLEDENYIV